MAQKAKIKPKKWEPINDLRKCHGCEVRYDCKELDTACLKCIYYDGINCINKVKCDGYWMRKVKNRLYKCNFISK